MRALSWKCAMPAKRSSTSTPFGAARYIWKPLATENLLCFITMVKSTWRIESGTPQQRASVHVQRFAHRRITTHPPDLGIKIVVNQGIPPEERDTQLHRQRLFVNGDAGSAL